MNPYQTLGLTKEAATPDRVRRAYRKKAAAAHPDNHATGNVEEFRQIAKAHKLLSDPVGKKIYDETGIVMGEDRQAEEAIMLIISLSAEILARSPECDLPQMLKATLANLDTQTDATVELIEKAIKQVESRWQGAESARDALLMNMHARVAEMNRKKLVQQRAAKLLEGASYKPAEEIEFRK